MTIRQLASQIGARVYVYLADEETAKRFLQDAEKEGFLFADGVKPTQRKADCIYALNSNMTINYVGFTGHMAYGCAGGSDKSLIRVDYRDFLNRAK